MKPHIWLFQDGEPLPIDSNAHLMRTGLLAERLVKEGFKVTWWSSRFDHMRKINRDQVPEKSTITQDYSVRLLNGPAYKSNFSLNRIRHHRACASHFKKVGLSMERPDIILASYPSPELCHAASQYAKKKDVPFIVDVRDPWPAIFPDYFHRVVRWAVYPLCFYYDSIFRSIAKTSWGIVAVSKSMLEWAKGLSPWKEKRDRDCLFYIGYNSFPLKKDLNLPEAFSEDKPLHCLFVSSAGKSYDGFTLIEAARILKEKNEKRVKFIITNDGEMTFQWKEKAVGLENVLFTGRLSHGDLQKVLLEAHVGLILMQGGIARFWVGNKIFEYLAASLALVNNVPGDTAEIVDNFNLGVNIDSKNPLMLAETLGKLIDNPSIIKGYTENSRKTFDEHFERDKIYDCYVAYLKQQINH